MKQHPIEWRKIPFLDDCYEASNTGRIRRCVPGNRTYVGRERSVHRNHYGYMCFVACIGGRYRSVSVHRAVAWAFLGDPPVRHAQVNHKNGDKSDNRVENLEWCTRAENVAHARHMGLCHDEKAVIQLDRTSGAVVAVYPSLHAAAKAVNGHVANISACCSHVVRRTVAPKTAHGYLWIKFGRKVEQRDINGALIAVYDSQAEASRATGISSGQLSACCNGRHYGKPAEVKTAYGFLWRFKEEK